MSIELQTTQTLIREASNQKLCGCEATHNCSTKSCLFECCDVDTSRSGIPERLPTPKEDTWRGI